MNKKHLLSSIYNLKDKLFNMLIKSEIGCQYKTHLAEVPFENQRYEYLRNYPEKHIDTFTDTFEGVNFQSGKWKVTDTQT